jgi:hypothetical protein
VIVAIQSIMEWLLPAVAAASASYIASLLRQRWCRIHSTNKSAMKFLAALSFLMGAVCAHYRAMVLGRSLENNILVMFFAGGITTLSWLLLR